ncbi:MAG: hypothetical protein RLZZ519_1358 [Bacteroidota bacterium]|jgi:hypothetical protein
MDKIGNRKVKAAKEEIYLTKRVLVKASSKATSTAAEMTMTKMGHLVASREGFIVRMFSDGRYEAIEKLTQFSGPRKLD